MAVVDPANWPELVINEVGVANCDGLTAWVLMLG